MQSAVIRFANKMQNGLCLIDMPTGSGKTYQTRQLIKRYLEGEILTDVPSFFYLTPLRKNIDDIYKELREDFKDNESVFDANVLRIYANYECVLESLTRVSSKISKSLKEKESYINLFNKIQTYEKLKENEGISEDILSTSLKEIRKDYEPKFRKDLEEELNKLAKTTKGRKDLINHDYSWVKEIYPSCLSADRKVFFMTMDKFLSGNDPIISKSYSFLTHSKTKGALVFIDEFDATKDVILKQEIANCTDYKLDLARLFSGIATALKGKEFPNQLFEGSDDLNDDNSSRSSFEKMKAKILQVEEEYHLNYVFKLDSSGDDSRYFLFDDYQLHTITSNKKNGKITCRIDKKKNQNVISLVDDKHDDKGQFYRSIYGMKGALNYFINCCAMISRNYLNYYNERAVRENKEIMEIEQAVSTVIDPFNLDRNVSETISKMIVDNISLPVANRKKDILANDFYLDGFRYYDFKDDISHDASTSFLMCYMDNTPEKIMLSLSSRARVVGLSATASIQSVTGNYNIEYLEEKLGELYYVIPEFDKDNIRKEVNERLKGDYKICVKEEKIVSRLPREISSCLFKTADNVEQFSGLFEKYTSVKDDNYQLARLSKTLYAIRDFIDNKTSKVLLVLTNKNINTANTYDVYSESNIKKIISAFALERKIDPPKIHHLFGNDFEKEKQTYLDEVNAGDRIILFSCYQSVGTGQNLQYEETDGEDTIKKDIDSLYIEYPTHRIVQSKNTKEETELIKYIYQIETLTKNGEINFDSAMFNIKAAFKQYNLQNTNVHFQNIAYVTESVNNDILKVLVQAVGRICRTGNEAKKHDVNIYVDEEIYEKVNFSTMKNRLMNPEFNKVVQYTRKKDDYNNDAVYKLNKANYNNNIVTRRIENILSENKKEWGEDDIRQWELIRKIVLMYPTISRERLDEVIKETNIPNLRSFYLEALNGSKIYNYLYWIDPNDNEDAMKFPISYKMSEPKKGQIIINDEGARLTALMRIPEVKKEFERNGYAVSFAPNELIILPVVYQNIYKGALGEEAGRVLLNSLGVKVQPITDLKKYEKFDFELVDNNNIFVDFKNWSETDIVEKKQIIEHSAEKLKLINGKKAFIVNLVANDFEIHDNGQIVEISSLIKPKDALLYKLDSQDNIRIYKKFMEAISDGNN